MAKFSTCYQLCPLIDQKCFLGVADESVNGCVIITLGKNMVIRYKLSDQKQVSSWSSKDKLTAPVVYDAINQQYIGVFNANQISTWEESCVQLNNLKKFKFTNAIDCILTSPSSATPVVVFRNGIISPLQKALDRRKDPVSKEFPLNNDESIVDAHLVNVVGSLTVALFTTHEDEYRLHLVPLEEGLLAKSCLQLKRKAEDKVKLIGHALLAHEACQLLTLWSDGQLCILELPAPDLEQFPGRVLTTVTTISPRHQAAILSLSPTHLAIYGADANEEGAVLFIFNSQLGVIQCKQYFKLYTEPARLWAGGRTALLVAAGQYVTVVPYHLGKQRLAALVGSQESDVAAATQTDWSHGLDQEMKQEEEPKVTALQNTINSYLKEGMSQRIMCQNLIVPTIDCNDVNSLKNLLQNVTDIPELCIISVLAFCLKDIDHEGHRELLHSALRLPVTADLSTVRLLRHKLSLSSVITLLKELCEAMLETPGDPQLIEWTTLLLDAHYQQYLLSRDEAVLQTLSELKAIVDMQLKDLKIWQQLEPLLLQLQNQQGLSDPALTTNTSYCIEQITLN